MENEIKDEFSQEFPEGLKYDYKYYRSSSVFFPAHSHNAYELIFIIRGDASYVIEDREYKLNNYDLVITSPRKHHYIRLDSPCDYERFDVLIAPAHPLADILKDLPDSSEVVHCLTNKVITENFNKIKLYYRQFSEEICYKLITSLLTEILYNVSASENELFASSQIISPLIRKALAYINAHLFTIKNISEICNELFIAKNYFFRLFKSTLKVSPKKYILDKRLLYAQGLLSSGEKPTAVYRECGFSNYVSFYKSYVALFGHSPSSENKR